VIKAVESSQCATGLSLIPFQIAPVHQSKYFFTDGQVLAVECGIAQSKYVLLEDCVLPDLYSVGSRWCGMSAYSTTYGLSLLQALEGCTVLCICY